MDNERTADVLQVALASYDRKELRVQKNYLEEQNPVLACTCFLNGHKLLQELQQGHNFDIVVLCSQMEDMSSIEFMMELRKLLQQVAAQADMVRAQLGVTLELDYGGWTTCRVLADRDDVELLCLHLLSNALRACREGGTVRILLRRSETMWQLTVRDNGCGLPEGSQEAWLENRRSFLGGAQLGLLLCRECCRRMGWGLSVECAPEKGTQAVVTVPLYTDDGRAPEVELHAGADLASEQHQYQLRAMLVRELRTMPERGDPDE